MHLAYSAFTTIYGSHHPASGQHEEPDNTLLLRYQAYQAVCGKYSREIAAIQKYVPGWMPKFR